MDGFIYYCLYGIIMPKLEVRNLKKTFGDEVAVSGVDLELMDGEFKTLVGPSGCGKTTTLRCLAGLEKPTGGEIYINDELVASPEDNVHLPPNKRDIGMVFQSYAVWPHMTVEENILFPLSEQSIGTKSERKERVQDIIRTVGLEVHSDDLASNLSGGQQQRVALARALITDPELLLLDEPLSNLDAKLRREMRNEIKRISDEMNVSVLYVTHSQDEALYLSDNIAVMNDGNIVEENNPREILANPQRRFTMNFMGRSNMLSGTVESMASDVVIVNTAVGSVEVPSEKSFTEGQSIYAAFRPQHATIYESDTGSAAGPENFEISGTVTSSGLTQEMVEYNVESQDTELMVLTQDDQLIGEGEAVTVTIPRERIKLYPSDDGKARDVTPMMEPTA
jgi:iron(III) transport system ATP-binding protein